MRKLAITIAIITLTSAMVRSQNKSVSLSVAKTDAGTVSGVKNSSGDVTVFKGVPFAAPPVGNLRWKAPQPVAHWEGIKKCEAFSASPVQPAPQPYMAYTSEFLIPEKPISEDCLYLNVWTGAKSKAEKRPVFVWIYGGGFFSGGSACPIYDGEALAKKGIIFVSVNYRLGVFGFFAHPELTKESSDNASGNYGLLDQIAALKWIKANIAAFGGDPNRVTIAGQSAGAMSVNALVASPLAKGLFNRAIAESGSLTVKNPNLVLNSLASAEAAGERTAKKAGANSLADLRAMTTEDVMKKLAGMYLPIVDGHVLPQPITEIFAQHKENRVPVITGWTDAEFDFGPTTKDNFTKQAQKNYGAGAETFLKYFPAGTDAEASTSQLKLNRDQLFALSAYNWANVQGQYSDAPVYLYSFNRKVPGKGDLARYGAFHGSEIGYALDNLRFFSDRPLEPADHGLANLMSDYWVNFIKTGNPNGKGLPEWPKYTTGNNLVKVFDAKSETQKLADKGALDFLLSKAEK